MSPIAALRSRRSLEGIPPLTSDEDLIAWSHSLVHERATVVEISVPAPATATPSRRREPLRAADRASCDIRTARTDGFITADEIFDEIRERLGA